MKTGKTSCLVTIDLEADPGTVVVLQKLVDHCERCVTSLNWEGSYVADLFYRYMPGEFGCM